MVAACRPGLTLCGLTLQAEQIAYPNMALQAIKDWGVVLWSSLVIECTVWRSGPVVRGRVLMRGRLWAQAAVRRRAWRAAQGAVQIQTPDVDVKVALNGDDSVREIQIVTSRQGDSPSQSLVTEMMILTGQVIGDLGAPPCRRPLPLLAIPTRQENFRALTEATVVLWCKVGVSVV